METLFICTEESWKLSRIIHFVILMGTGDIPLKTRENDTI